MRDTAWTKHLKIVENDDPAAQAEWGVTNADWLDALLDLPRGAPSQDVI
ncbi:MAG: hypothetical protein ACI81R_001320 [Bradymonadia bacterium]